MGLIRWPVLKKGPKGAQSWINGGLLVCEPAIFDFIPADDQCSLESDILPAFLAARKQNAAYLAKALSDLRDDLVLPEEVAGTESSWFGYLLGAKNPRIKKEALVRFLEEHGVGTRPLFAGNLLRQPLGQAGFKLRIGEQSLKASDQLTEEDFKELAQTDNLMRNFFWIGVYPGLNEVDLAKSVTVLRQGIKQLTSQGL